MLYDIYVRDLNRILFVLHDYNFLKEKVDEVDPFRSSEWPFGLNFDKICSFESILQNLSKIPNWLRTQCDESQRVFIEKMFEIVRLKALNTYFVFLTFASTYEHFASIYENMQITWFSQFLHIFLILPSHKMLVHARKCSWSARKCSQLL